MFRYQPGQTGQSTYPSGTFPAEASRVGASPTETISDHPRPTGPCGAEDNAADRSTPIFGQHRQNSTLEGGAWLRKALASIGLLLLAIACSNPGSGKHDEDPKTPNASAEDDEHLEQEEHGEDEDHDANIVELTLEAASWIQIQTAPVEERTLAAQLSTTGQVDFDQTRLAHVSPRISGRVHRVDAILGQEIRVGQTLAEIDSIDLGKAKASYLQAKAKEELARRSFERAEELFANQIASEQTTLEAKAVLRVATAELHTAEGTLRLYGSNQAQIDRLAYDERSTSLYSLRAPFAGTIVERHVTLGELVTPERNLFTLADLDRVWIWIDIYQRDLGQVHIDDLAQARVDAFPDEAFDGKLSYMSAKVDADTRTVRARVDVANPGGKLRPGMFVQVDLLDPHTGQASVERQTSLVVPKRAVLRDGGERFVFVEIGALRFERRDVRIGREAGDYVEIRRGVELGSQVVVDGAFFLESEMSKQSLGGGHAH